MTIIAFLLSGTALADDDFKIEKAHFDYRAAYHHHMAKDYDAALTGYEINASVGLAKSEYAIGRIFAFDREDDRDLTGALPWIIRAAHPFADDPKCWHGRAKALIYGRYDIPKDEDAARALLEKAIAAGHLDAQVTLDKLNACRAPRLKIKPIDKSKLALLLFLLLIAGMVFKDYRVRQRLYGWLYKNSA